MYRRFITRNQQVFGVCINVIYDMEKIKLAQLVIMPYMSVEFDEVDELSDTERGSGGFGSTGTK